MLRFATNMIGVMVALVLGIAGPATAAALDPERFMPLDEVERGQQAVALTVFHGTMPDSFSLEILGVLEHIGPGQNLILARAGGEYLAKTGIIAGMSGSPVYVGGRLIGAMAYAWTFATEPIVGITPIGEMMELTERSDEPTSLGLGPETGMDLAWGEGPEEFRASDIRPIGTPIVLAGFADAARPAWQAFFSSLGFVGVEAGGRAPAGADLELVPGSALGVQLVRGDANTTAVGTVTWVEGGRVLGFGHPFLLAGPVSLPMSTVFIHTVLPSQVSSFKIGAPGPSVGAIVQDRRAGVFGVVGQEAPMIPVSVTVVSGEDGVRDEYHYEITRAEMLVPDLVGLVGFSSVAASEKVLGKSTLGIRTRIEMAAGRVFESEIAVASTMPPAAVTEQIGWPVRALTENPFEKVDIEGISVEVEVVDRLRVAEIEGLRVDRPSVHPGDEVTLWVKLRPYREPEFVRRTRLRIPPATPPGKLELSACASGDLWEREAERAPLLFEPTDLDQLLQLMGRRRSTQNVYLQVFEPRDGKVVSGRELPRLPGSVLSVMDGGTRSGGTGPSEGAVVVEGLIETEWVVVGCKRVTIDVVPR